MLRTEVRDFEEIFVAIMKQFLVIFLLHWVTTLKELLKTLNYYHIFTIISKINDILIYVWNITKSKNKQLVNFRLEIVTEETEYLGWWA